MIQVGDIINSVRGVQYHGGISVKLIPCYDKQS